MDILCISSDDEDIQPETESIDRVKQEPQEEINGTGDQGKSSCKHSDFLRSYCIECGIEASLSNADGVQKDYEELDKYINASKKARIAIARDGHCLPRAVFRGCKELNGIPQYNNYKQLFRAVVERINGSIHEFADFLSYESNDSALKALDSYLLDNKYSLPSNIIDVVLFSLACVTGFNIKVHYKDMTGAFDTHLIPARISSPYGTIELAFLHGHYDLISKQKSIKEEARREHFTGDGNAGGTNHSLESTPMFSDVRLQFNNQNDDRYSHSIFDDSDDLHEEWENTIASSSSLTSEDETDSDDDGGMHLNRTRGAADWSDLRIKKIEQVPDNIDGLKVYEVEAKDRENLLKKCRDGRKWKRDSETKWKGYEKVRYRDCSGCLQCPNIHCEYIKATGDINKLKFCKREESCEICGAPGIRIECSARKYVATNGLVAHIYHRGDHTCKAIMRTDNSKVVYDALLVSPTVTPSSIKAGVVLSAMRARKPWEAVEREALKLVNKKALSNEKVKQQKKFNPAGFSFAAVKEYKDYTDLKDKSLVYKIDEDKGTVFKSSNTKMKIANGLCSQDHFLSTEFCFFDGNEKRAKDFTTLSASIYHPLLRKQIPLATMECPVESGEYVELFWRQFNACYSAANEIHEKFFPIAGWVTDMADGNFNGLKLIYGEDVMQKIKGCEWHFQQSMGRTSNRLEKENDREQFKLLSLTMLGATNEAAYFAEYEKLSVFLAASNIHMLDWLKWWHSRRTVIFRAFTGSEKPRVNQAEVVHAGWKNSREIGFTLLTAAEFDTKDAIYLDCEFKLYEQTRNSIGKGPSLAELKERRGEREVTTGKRMGRDLLGYDVTQMGSPDKKKTRKEKVSERMLDLQVKKAEEEKNAMKIRKSTRVSSLKRVYEVSNTNSGKAVYTVTVSNLCSCTCPYSRKHGEEVFCKHTIFVIVHALKGNTNESSLRMRYFGDDDLKNLFAGAGLEVSPEFMQEKQTKKTRADMIRLLAASPNFNDEQTWSRIPKDGKQGRCFQCKRDISVGETCLQVEGALVLPFADVEPRKQKFFSCTKKVCYMLPPPWTNIRKPTKFADDATRSFFDSDC